MITLFTITMYLSTLAITIIPFIRDIVNPITKKLTKWGTFLICIAIIGLIANYFKDKITSDEDKAALSQRDKDHKQDEIELQKDYEKSLVENSRKNLSTYTDALAKYNLQYIEGQNKVIKMLRDSSNRPLNIPFVSICRYPVCSVEPISFEYKGKDTLLGAIKYANTGTPALNIKVNIIACVRVNGQLFIYRDLCTSLENKKLNSGEFTTLTSMILDDNRIETLYYCINGNCENSDGKEFKIFGLHEYNFKEKKYVGNVMGVVYNEVLSYIKKSNML